MQSWDTATAKFFPLLALVRAREVLPRSPFRPQSGDRLALKVVLVRVLWIAQWCRSNLRRYPRLFGPPDCKSSSCCSMLACSCLHHAMKRSGAATFAPGFVAVSETTRFKARGCRQAEGRCPLMAQSGHAGCRASRPLVILSGQLVPERNVHAIPALSVYLTQRENYARNIRLGRVNTMGRFRL